MKRIEVKPCPACGRSPVIDTKISADGATQVTLGCPACDAELGYWEIEPGEEYILNLGTVSTTSGEQDDEEKEAAER